MRKLLTLMQNDSWEASIRKAMWEKGFVDGKALRKMWVLLGAMGDNRGMQGCRGIRIGRLSRIFGRNARRNTVLRTSVISHTARDLVAHFTVCFPLGKIMVKWMILWLLTVLTGILAKSKLFYLWFRCRCGQTAETDTYIECLLCRGHFLYLISFN